MNVVLLCGCPASGKSTYAQQYIDKGYVCLSRDKEGKTTNDLLPKMDATLLAKQNIILDNTFPTALSRKPFIEMAKKHGADIDCVHLTTTIEDAQINSLLRMYKKYNKFFMGPNDCDGLKDNTFPVAVLFKYRKMAESPLVEEGFRKVETVKFKRQWGPEYTNKAIFLDYDDTLRITFNNWGYPTHPDEVQLLPNRKKKLDQCIADGYKLLGVSNQSGVHKGVLTLEDAHRCFQKTNELLGHDIDYAFCPHNSAPISCYCRKPQTGMLVSFIEKYQINPAKSIFVGDRTTDKTAADRVGIPFIHADKFFLDNI